MLASSSIEVKNIIINLRVSFRRVSCLAQTLAAYIPLGDLAGGRDVERAGREGHAVRMATPNAPLVCHGHSRPINHLEYSRITDDGVFLISSSKGEMRHPTAAQSLFSIRRSGRAPRAFPARSTRL